MSEIDENKVENEDENKTPDKKQIEAEEKEVMLKVDIDKIETPEQKLSEDDGERPVKAAITEEGREVKPKFIPIGGIKMPGFFTRNSDKDKNKDEETADNDDKDKSEGAKPKRHRLQFLHTCPFTQFLHHPRNQDASNTENSDGSKSRIVDRIRVPLNNMLKKSTNKDPEAALASMETLEDKLDTTNDGMENVKLDGDQVDEGKVATKLPLKERIRQRKFIIDDIVVCALALLVLLAVIVGVVVVARAGPPEERPLRAGRYITTLTTCGHVEGVLNESVYNFYGIPYAVPPVGERRFTYAQPLNNISFCWNGTLKAHEPVPACLQFIENSATAGREDCLTLDVATPHVRYNAPLPVVVLVGADTLAGGEGPLRASALYSRTKEVVFVKPNFRLGVFGFLALDILSADRYPATSGNYGLSDLLVALEWVQRNIKHFGGDPGSVTLLGHRAGATLAAAFTAVRDSHKLYSRAWLSSPSVIFPGEPLETAHAANEAFKHRSKCNDAACLRRLAPLELLTATPDVWLGDTSLALPARGETARSWLVLDGVLLRVHPYETWDERRKERDRRPLVFGSARHAAHSPALARRHANWTADDVRAEIAASALSDLPAAALGEYNTTYAGLAELTSAVRTVCPLVSLARMRLSAPLYVVRGAGGARLADARADVQAILGTFDSDTPEQRRYMNAMQHLFYYFVWNGRLPSGSDAGLLAVEQDVAPITEVPGCDALIKNDIVPRYAHVD